MKIFVLPHILLLLNLYQLTDALSNKFHHLLSEEDLGNLFNVKSHAEVPEYDIVRIHSRTKRSATDPGGEDTKTVRINAFGQKKTLNLKKNKLLSPQVPVFFADTHKDREGVVLTPLGQNPDVGEPYQDENSRTAVMVSRDPHTGHLTIDGTIGEDLVVRPIPSPLHGLLPPTNERTRGREEEASENALTEDDDELFMDQKEDDEDLVFSDGLPLVADDEVVTGSSVLPAEESKGNNVTKGNLPDGLLLLRKRRTASGASSGVHVIYKRKLPIIDTDYAMMELDKVPVRSPDSRSSRRKRDAPYVIYPEILVLVDYDGYLLHGQDNTKIKSYYVSFWNGVDLRYKLLSNPRVKVSIAGIIISRSRDAMPYLERNRVGRDAIDSASALTDMGKYLYQERRLPTYDIAVAITKYDLCRRRKSGNCTTGTAGFAYVGGACVVNKRLQKVNSVAIVEDTGGFSGIIVAAHEVGHLLGAVHDGSPPPSYLGGPGARHCKWKDGFIMSDLRHTERGFRWSPCSVEQFHHFLNGETATCLYNLPHEDESLPRILPGKLLSLDAQCSKDRGTTACFKDDRVCAQLFCFDSASGFCVSYRPAAEGSQCGGGKICLNGKCVYDNENSISDIDIHRQEDNLLHESTTSTTTTTTKRPYTTTTKRSRWWEKDNSWKKGKDQTTTRKPKTNPRYTTSRWRPFTSKSTTSSTPYFTTTTTTRKPFTKKYFTTKRTTPTTTTRKPTTSRYYSKEKEKNKPYNSIDDSNENCVDKLIPGSGTLSCQDFLKKYGSRYCNHRYIEKNCCQSKKDFCS